MTDGATGGNVVAAIYCCAFLYRDWIIKIGIG
jgi:hypothetical protein